MPNSVTNENSLNINGSLFTCFTATVTVNSLENEMSSELLVSRLKMGEGRKQGNPRDPKGREGLPLLETPPFLTAKMQILRISFYSFVFFNVAR